MLKNLILFFFVVNIAFAQSRFSETDRKIFLDDVKQAVAEHKVENNGRVDLQIIRPGFYAELEEYAKQEKFTREEMVQIKQRYEAFSRDRGITPERAEEAFYNFIQKELEEINKKPLEKIKEGKICNNWSCANGLHCAPDPVQDVIGKGKKAGAACVESSECASMDCVEETPGSKKKVCEEVYRCFKALSLGESCSLNPVCGVGSCLPYNSLTSGIGECEVQGNSCRKNSDCCSNSCNGGICKPNFICKDCVSSGSRPQRGQRCCEGLYLNEKGVCAPDVPPVVIPQVRVLPFKNLFISMANMLISSASAETALESSQAQSDADKAAAAAAAAGDAEFLSKGATSDGLDIKSGINADRDKYKNFQATSKEGKALNMEEKKANLVFDKKSNFDTCDIRFRDDFYNALRKDGSLDYEAAMLAFDFVITGDSEPDYWTLNSSADTSIYNRLKVIGENHKKTRARINERIKKINHKLTCMCLDVQGLDKIKDDSKKKYFQESCEEYAKYADPNTGFDELSGDASGLKAKRLLTVWTSSMQSFHASLTIDNNTLYSQLGKVASWSTSEAKWNETKSKKYELFKFSVLNPNGSAAALGGLVGALLAAGVIAILGGFATTSILNVWSTALIISATSAAGAGGLWMIASLKGAWITQGPKIDDYDTPPQGYGCGKKQTCVRYTRTLVQPYNDICKIHASSNACVKNFVVVNDQNESRYIVDPWIPAGVNKADILMGQPDYAKQLEVGFKAAKDAMVAKNPGASGGGGKKGGGEHVSTNYLYEVFIDAAVIGKYLPPISQNLESIYYMDTNRVKLIKDAAKAFAISEGFLEKDETANLEAFANYAYDYHFLWPKKSRPEEISYPTAGLSTYLNYMSKNVAGNLSTGFAKTAIDLGKLNAKYMADYLNTLELYADKPINQADALKKSLLNDEINKTKKELDTLLTMNAMLDNKGLDKQLSNMDNNFVSQQAKIAGADSANFNEEQKGFMNAVGNLRTTRKEQLKSLDTYNKAMAQNGDKDRMAKVANASQKFSKRFSTANSATSSGSGFSFASYGGAATGSTADAKKEMVNYGVGGGSVGSYGSGAGSLYGSGSGSSGGSSKSSGTDGSGAVMSGEGSQDQNKLADAIDARNKANKDKYQSNDGLSLFEKVTNAYIRNYDKVLMKRKDKDVIEDKQ